MSNFIAEVTDGPQEIYLYLHFNPEDSSEKEDKAQSNIFNRFMWNFVTLLVELLKSGDNNSKLHLEFIQYSAFPLDLKNKRGWICVHLGKNYNVLLPIQKTVVQNLCKNFLTCVNL